MQWMNVSVSHGAFQRAPSSLHNQTSSVLLLESYVQLAVHSYLDI